MNRIFFLSLLAWVQTVAFAQPAAVQKVRQSVFTLTTFRADGSILASSRGMYIGNGGEAVAPWTPFVGAAKAIVVDAQGIQHDVEAIYGANELYDICKFRTTSASAGSPLAKGISKNGSTLWLVDYSLKKANCKSFTIKSVETFMQNYGYYILNDKAPDNTAGCPFVNQNGEIVGMLQHAKSGEAVHAVDVRLISDTQPQGLSINDPLLRQTTIRVALPDNLDNARLTLMLAGEKNDSAAYAAYVADFIRQFPHVIDGYTARAQAELKARQFAQADATINEALEKAGQKDEVHSAYSTLIYQKNLYYPTPDYEAWTLQKALEEAQTAYAIQPLSIYQHQQAQVLYAMESYQEAYDMLINLTKSPIRNGELFYEAALCCPHIGKTNEDILTLLDSAVSINPNQSISAPYYLARGRMLDELGEYRKAMADYNRYDTLVYFRGSDEFYYTRFKCELRLRQYQQALNDIAHAIVINRSEPTYYAEMAALQLRINRYEDAIQTADMCLQIDPEYTDPYIVKGMAHAELQQKKEAKEAFEKAKQLGDARADELISKYGL